MSNFFKKFAVIPFETATSFYVIMNGILTLNVNSEVFHHLYELLGFTGLFAPILQIIAGFHVLIGVGKQKSNMEAAGLILASALFLVRSILFLTDGEISLEDINACFISLLILGASLVRITQILRDTKISLLMEK